MNRIAVLAAGIGLLMVGCADRLAQEEAQIQEDLLSSTVEPVTFVQPTVQDLDKAIEVSGTFETLAEVQVGAKVAGRLIQVLVADGARVRAGQVIARVEATNLILQVTNAQAAVDLALSRKAEAALQAHMTPEQTDAAVRGAQAAVEVAKAQLQIVREGAREQEKEQARQSVRESKAKLDKAKSDLDRMQDLYDQEAIAKSVLESAQLEHQTAIAAYQSSVEAYDLIIAGARPAEIQMAEEGVRQAEEQLRSARANQTLVEIRNEQLSQADSAVRQAEAGLRMAEKALNDASITAPVTGQIYGRPAQVGQVVAPGTTVATIIGLDAVYFDAQVPELLIAEISVGQQVVITADAFSDTTFNGTVSAISPAADQLGRLIAVRVTLANPGGQLRPGMFARGRIVTDRVMDALLIPRNALLQDEDSAYVWVKNGESRVRRVDVTVGTAEGELVQVSGIDINDNVILKGKDKLTSSTIIEEWKEPTS